MVAAERAEQVFRPGLDGRHLWDHLHLPRGGAPAGSLQLAGPLLPRWRGCFRLVRGLVLPGDRRAHSAQVHFKGGGRLHYGQPEPPPAKERFVSILRLSRSILL